MSALPTGTLKKVDIATDLVAWTKRGERVTKEITKKAGRSGKQARLRELADDPKLGKADTGWIKQEKNSIARGTRKTIRTPLEKT